MGESIEQRKLRMHPRQLIRAESLKIEDTLIKDELVVIVPTDYLHGAVRLSMPYEIAEGNRANHIGDLRIISCYQDGTAREGPQPIGIVSKIEIVENLALALKYFAYTRESLESGLKTVPIDFVEFCKSH